MRSTEPHGFNRPPYATTADLVELLRPLVDEFGAGVVSQAAQRLVDSDPVEQARIEADVRRVLAGSPLLDQLFPATAATAA